MKEDGFPKGAYTHHHGIGRDFAHMTAGKRYRVIKAFIDYDRCEHPVGEEWTYLGTAFLPYDDGRSLFVSADGEKQWHIRMQDRAEEQGPILDTLRDYIAET